MPRISYVVSSCRCGELSCPRAGHASEQTGAAAERVDQPEPVVEEEFEAIEFSPPAAHEQVLDVVKRNAAMAQAASA